MKLMISNVARLNVAVLGVGTIAVIAVFTLSTSSQRGEIALSPYCTQAQASPEIVGKAAYAKDLITGTVLYEKNSSAQLPLASITKIMTVISASEILPKESVVTVTKEALEPEGDSGLYENEQWSVRDLVDFTLMSSLNDGAHALALSSASLQGKSSDWFVEAMNKKAKSIGLSQTYFLNDTGLDVSSSTAGAYGSAHDVAEMLTYAITSAPVNFHGSTEQKRTFVSLSSKEHEALNTSEAGVFLENAIASKTGFTDLAGGNLAAVFEPFIGRPVVAVVLGSTKEERDADMKVIATGADKELRRILLCKQLYGSH